MPDAAALADPPSAPAAGRASAEPAKAGKPAKTATKTKSGPQRALEKLGLLRPIDFALHLPLRYEDETRLAPIGALRDGQVALVEGEVRECRVEQRMRRMLVVRLADASGEIWLRFLHFYPAQQRALAVGARIRARGEVRGGFVGAELVHPAFRVVTEGEPLAATLTPVYPTSAQLPQAYLRRAVAARMAQARIDEVLPPGVVPDGLPALRDAVHALHYPAADAPLASLEDRSHPAWQRLKFEELLAQQLSQIQAQRERARLHAPRLVAPVRTEGGPLPLTDRLLAALPFALTAAQRRVIAEIARDLGDAQPMHRLLQGDVGSGKTVVAALAAAVAIDAGWQCALMAPTELLAAQHFDKLIGWLEPLGVGVARLAGHVKGKARAAAMAAVADGTAQLVVGTHAVIQEKVAFRRLGLAVVDEQHRFGVQQRLELRRKLHAEEDGAEALEPHLLMMTATPIPRTLAMTYYADLAVSTIDELPPGRTPVVTKVFAESRRDEVIVRIRHEVSRGRQVYWVCPLIEESEALDLRDATETHRQLRMAFGEAVPPLEAPDRAVADDVARGTAGVPTTAPGGRPLVPAAAPADAAPDGPPSRIGLLHGRMHPTDKAAVMARFVAGQIDVLVATTVIEVGVDVANASLMVVEHAERFGLGQLHQLRGRVGRGAAASACVLLYASPLGVAARERLKAMLETSDGFEIARRDLAIRGPGEFMGARQSGDALLRFADMEKDTTLLDAARAAAPRLLAEHPEAAAAHVERWLAGKAEYVKA